MNRRQGLFGVYLIFIHFLQQELVLSIIPSGVTWIPPRWHGLPLYCPEWCNREELCCNCHSITVFDFDNNPCRANVSSLGDLVDSGCKGNTVLDHTFQKLYKFPDNMCDYPGIAKIILSGNFILDIPHLSCLSNLTYVDLSRNKITTLRQASLIGNRNLRFVDLSFNSITYIDTGVLESLSFLTMNLKNNSMTTLDVTDLMISRPLCELDVSYNGLESIVNNNNWTVNLTHYYGYGMYNVSYNHFKSLPDWKKIGFSSLNYLGKILQRGYDIRHNPISCDCKLAEPLVFFRPLLAFDQDLYDIKCQSPKTLMNWAMRSFFEGNSIIELVCNYTGNGLCPSHCTCVTEPRYFSKNQGRVIFATIINCSHSTLQRLPHILPESDEIEFYFTGDSIKNLLNEHYLPRVTVLKLQSMPYFGKIALKNLKSLKQIYLPRTAQINGIPKEMSFFHPCVFLHEDNFVMNCTCSLQWMTEWLSLAASEKCRNNFKFQCLRGNKTETASTYLQNMNCSGHTHRSTYVIITSMFLAALIFVCCGVAVCKLKCEIRILLRESKLGRLMRLQTALDQDRVVFISFDGSNQCIHSFIFTKLEPFLVRNGFHVFIPPRDLALGSVRSEEAAWQISASRYYITFLSLRYLDEDVFETRNEWRCIWNGYLSDNRKELLVLNYDLLKLSDVPCSKMRAVMRAGNIVDFDAGEKTILSRIVKTFIY